MTIDFDEIINRVDTHSDKWDSMQAHYNVSPHDGIPMWVADMDFKPPQAVADAVRDMYAHGVYGYYGDDTSFRNALVDWMQRRHDWTVQPDWIVNTHGLVNALSLAVHAFTDIGDSVVIFSPVYHAFQRLIKANDRRVVESELVLDNGRYSMDLDALALQLQGDEKLMFLCSPHNPGGRIWTQDELRALITFCAERDIILISDEVHHDIILDGNEHHVLAKIAPEFEANLITLAATTKTFNLAGSMLGSVIIENKMLREQFLKAQKAAGTSLNRFGMIMSEAAYKHGDEWLDALRLYLAENNRIFAEGIRKIPGLTIMPLEATYLAWVGFADTGMSEDEFNHRVTQNARIAGNFGRSFGAGGDGFMRFNLATRRALIVEAVGRLQDAFADLQ
ncbi:MalY/PatB family protein [Candidatus Puniceispirillum sp.]|uniref:MalY/PatB family protein n=1 Tax=Candidatus Puniceispirillum sp. TaxID=2026719 RepID=UPI003F6A0159